MEKFTTQDYFDAVNRLLNTVSFSHLNAESQQFASDMLAELRLEGDTETFNFYDNIACGIRIGLSIAEMRAEKKQ